MRKYFVYLRIPFMTEARSSKAYECRTGSSEQMNSCSAKITKDDVVGDNEPLTISTLSTRASNE
jgi:hypothetical protein